MAHHLLSDVDVIAISIVDKGANRKKFYLRKTDGEQDEYDVGWESKLVKTEDWSVVYCVVAAPGHREGPGIGAGTGLDDEWASDDEIRKAAHRFLKNGGLVNMMHQDLMPYGTVVENFVAQSDMSIGDEVIKSGSWVVGIEPTEEGREAIESEVFTGLSIQGSGVRTLVKADPKGAVGPKAKKCPSCSGTVRYDKTKCQNCGHTFAVKKVLGPPGTDISRNQAAARGPLRNLIAFYMKKPHPFRACVRDNTKRFGKERAERVCATLKDLGRGTTKWRRGGGKKISKAEDIPDWFVDTWTTRWVEDGFTGGDAEYVLKVLEGRKGTLKSAMSDDKTLLRSIAKALGIRADEDDDCGCNEEEDVVTDAVSDERLAKIEESVTKTTADVKALADRLADIAEKLAGKNKEEDEAKSVSKQDELLNKLDGFSGTLDELRQDVEKLSTGSSAQPGDDGVPFRKSDHALSGLLSD
jgi:hypothetical protein